MIDKKMSKILLALVLVVALVAMVGCGASNTNEKANNDQGKSAEKQGTSVYPDRPVKIIVPFSAGGGSDLTSRAMAGVAEQYLGQSLVVVDKPGGSGTVGTSYVAHAKPDGYTLLLAAIGPITMQPHYGGTDYKMDDMEPIAQAATVPIVLAVNADAPYDTLQDFIDYAKEHPGEIKYGNSAAGGAPHLAMEMFADMADIDIKAMPFKGGAPAVTAAVGGHIPAVVAHPSELLPQIQAGKLKALAVAEPERIEMMPDVPTFKEQGIDLQIGVWKGVAAPKGLPEDVKAKLTDAFEKIIKDKSFVKMMSKMGETVNYLNAEDFQAKWDKYNTDMEAVIKKLGMYGKNK